MLYFLTIYSSLLLGKIGLLISFVFIFCLKLILKKNNININLDKYFIIKIKIDLILI